MTGATTSATRAPSVDSSRHEAKIRSLPQMVHLLLFDLRRVVIVLIWFWVDFGLRLHSFWNHQNAEYLRYLDLGELAIPIVVALLFVGQAPGSRRAIWLTRPVDWKPWLAAKLLILALLFLPRIVVQIYAFQRVELEEPIRQLATVGMVSSELLGLVFFVTFATACRGFASFVFFVLIGSMVGSWLVVWIRNGVFGDAGIGAAEYVIGQSASTLLVAGALLLAVLQTFRRRDRRWLLGSLPFVAAALFAAPVIGARAVATWWPEEIVDVPIDLDWKILRAEQPERRTERGSQLAVHFDAEGLDPNLGMRIEEVRGVWEVSAGPTVDLVESKPGVCVFSEHSERRFPGLGDGLRGLPCRGEMRLPILGLAAARELQASKGTLRLEIEARVLRETVRLAPLEKGARFSRGFETFELRSVEHERQTADTTNTNLIFRRRYLVEPPRMRSSPEIYLLHGETGRFVEPGGVSSSSISPRLDSGAPLSLISRRWFFAISELEYSFPELVLEEAGSTTLADYQLVDLEIQESDAFRVRLEIEDFTPADYLP